MEGVDFNRQIPKLVFEQENESQKCLSPTKSDMQPTEYKETYIRTQWSFDKENLRKDFYSDEK